MKVSVKTYRILFLSILYVGLIIATNPTIAQIDSSYSEKFLDENELSDLIEITKYDKSVKKLRLKKRKKEQEDSEAFDIPKFSLGLGPIITSLLYVLITALVIFILFIIFSSIKVDKKIKPVAIPKQEGIENIEVIDTESGLQMAIKAENYREAVRMLFIKLLQVLTQEKSIDWKSDKTNRDYLKEMKNHAKVEHFNNLVIAYERIWYGSELIDKLFFEYLRTDFNKFYSIDKIMIDVKE